MTASVTPIRVVSEPAARSEERSQSICRAEYTAYPRESGDDETRVGFTLDQSNAGMCLGVAAPETVGTLLCVRLASIDGEAKDAVLCRVVWCNETAHPGHYRIGLSVVAQAARKMLSVRPGQRRGRTLAQSA